jgi:DNA repair protein RadD
VTLPPLWPHQIEGIRLAREAMRSHKRVVLQIPTGGGKTRLAVEVIRGAFDRGRPAVWLASRTDLVSQSFDVLERAGLAPGCIAAQCERPERPGLVQVASVQTLVARPDVAPPGDLVVVDECRHLGAGAERWAEVLDRWPNAYVLGLDATPERGDGTGLAPLFTHLIQVVSVRDLTLSGHLVPCDVVRPDRYLKQRGESGNKLAQDPVDAWIEHAAGRSGFMFSSNVEQAQEHAGRLNAKGVVTRCVHAKTPADERDAIFDGFRKKRIDCITNVYVCTEGIDLPRAEVCCLARGASTAGTVLQMVGRVLRVSSGKTKALLIDLPGITWLYGMPEDERLWSLDGRASQLVGQTCRVCGKPIDEYPCPHCGYEPDVKDAPNAIDQILNEKLAMVERLLSKSVEQQQELLTRWLVEAALRGRRSSSVVVRWNKLYPVPLDWKWYGKALHALTSDGNKVVAEWARGEMRRQAQSRGRKRGYASA